MNSGWKGGHIRNVSVGDDEFTKPLKPYRLKLTWHFVHHRTESFVDFLTKQDENVSSHQKFSFPFLNNSPWILHIVLPILYSVYPGSNDFSNPVDYSTERTVCSLSAPHMCNIFEKSVAPTDRKDGGTKQRRNGGKE